MHKITPFLWFNDQAEEAVKLYVSVFTNSRIGTVTRYGPAGPGLSGSVMTIAFVLDGQEFVALNGGPVFKFTEAVSFVVNCETQEEIDTVWQKLSAGGEPGRCGWLKDRFGLSWQVVPPQLAHWLADRDAARAQRVMTVMLQMGKLEIARLRQAYERD